MIAPSYKYLELRLVYADGSHNATIHSNYEDLIAHAKRITKEEERTTPTHELEKRVVFLETLVFRMGQVIMGWHGWDALRTCEVREMVMDMMREIERNRKQ